MSGSGRIFGPILTKGSNMTGQDPRGEPLLYAIHRFESGNLPGAPAISGDYLHDTVDIRSLTSGEFIVSRQ